MVSIWIFDLQKIGKGHQLCHQICCWMALFMSYKIAKKMADLSQIVFVWSTNELYRHAHGQADNSYRWQCAHCKFTTKLMINKNVQHIKMCTIYVHMQ